LVDVVVHLAARRMMDSAGIWNRRGYAIPRGKAHAQPATWARLGSLAGIESVEVLGQLGLHLIVQDAGRSWPSTT
jgi:hypothetical protein